MSPLGSNERRSLYRKDAVSEADLEERRILVNDRRPTRHLPSRRTTTLHPGIYSRGRPAKPILDPSPGAKIHVDGGAKSLDYTHSCSFFCSFGASAGGLERNAGHRDAAFAQVSNAALPAHHGVRRFRWRRVLLWSWGGQRGETGWVRRGRPRILCSACEPVGRHGGGGPTGTVDWCL